MILLTRLLVSSIVLTVFTFAPTVPTPADAVQSTGSTTPRFLADRFAEQVNVKDYGAVGDGSTSDQTSVAAAFASGVDVYWPDGTYLTTATIPNFHDVTHRGPGIVKRGSTLFTVEPKDGATNNLYVATTGNNANDGLSSSEPRASLQSMGNVIYGYAYGDVIWKINMAAGTYSESVSFSKAFPTPQRVQFLGAAVNDGTTPTTIFSAPALGVAGLYLQNYVRAHVEDIRFTGYRAGATPSTSSPLSGLTADTFCELYTRNVFADDNDIGVTVTNNVVYRIQAGVLSANGFNFKANGNSRGTLGYGGSAAVNTGATGTALLSATVAGGTGVHVSEQTMVHCDYCYIGSNVTGFLISQNSRIHMLGSIVTGNTIAGKVEGNSTFYDNPTLTNTFSSNTDHVLYKNGGVSVALDDELFNSGFKIVDTAGVNTQSTSPSTIFSKTFAAKELATRGASVKLMLLFDYVGTAGTKNITIDLGGTTVRSHTVAATTTDVVVEVMIWNRTAASAQKALVRITENGVVTFVDINVALALDLTASKTLSATHNVNNAADTSRFQLSELTVSR